MRTATQAMQSNKHWLSIRRSNLVKLHIFVVGGPRRQTCISTLIRIHCEIYGEGTCKGGLFGGEYAPFVVYRNILAFHCCPDGLKVAVEEQRVEATGWSHFFAEIEKIRGLLFCILTLSRQGKWGVVVVEGGFGIAKKTPEIHCCKDLGQLLGTWFGEI